MNKLPSHPGVTHSERVALRGSSHKFLLDPNHPFHVLHPSSVSADGKVSLYDFELAYAPAVVILEAHDNALFAVQSVPLEILLRVSIAVSSKEGGLLARPYTKLEALGRAVRTAALALRQAGLGDSLTMHGTRHLSAPACSLTTPFVQT
jgi:hypothetical protein